MLSDVAFELVEQDPRRALEIADAIGNLEVKQNILEKAAPKLDSDARLEMERDPSPPKSTVSIEEPVSSDPTQARRDLDHAIAQFRGQLKENGKDYDTVGLLNSAILALAAIDPAAAVELALTVARPYTWPHHRGPLLAGVGAEIASHNGPVELIRRLLDEARHEPNYYSQQPSSVDRLSESLVSRLSSDDEISAVLARMDDKNLAAEIGLEKFSNSVDAVPRLTPLLGAMSRVTDRLSALFRTMPQEGAQRALAALRPGPIQWWLKLALANDNPAAADELRNAAQATLSPTARFAAMLELSSRFRDARSLHQAAQILDAPSQPVDGNNQAGDEEDDKRRQKRLKLARVASAVDPRLTLRLYRDASLDIPERWHEEARTRN
jgi:hypothetical protein